MYEMFRLDNDNGKSLDYFNVRKCWTVIRCVNIILHYINKEFDDSNDEMR